MLVAFKEKKQSLSHSLSYASWMGDAPNSNSQFHIFWLGKAKYEM